MAETMMDEKSPKDGLVFVEGLMLFPQPYNVPWDQHIHDLRTLTLRDDDVFLYAYPKAGTHWLWEVIHMLLSGETRFEPRTKECMTLEFSTKEYLDAEPSPRIFNTHLPFSMLPAAAIKQKKIKVIHVYRNPKDTVVSEWFHFKQDDYYKDLTLSQFVLNFIQGPVSFGSYPQFLKQTERFIDDNPDIPIFNVSFEETKRDYVGTVKRLADFLGVTTTEELCQKVAESCSFQNLRKASEDKTIPQDTVKPLSYDMYRKGEVGDWKNHLTAEDEALLDAFISDGLRGLTKFNIEYE